MVLVLDLILALYNMDVQVRKRVINVNTKNITEEMEMAFANICPFLMVLLAGEANSLSLKFESTLKVDSIEFF